MKGTLGPTIFTHRCEHILTNLKIIQGKIYPDDFSDVKGISYGDYKHRAKRKNLVFELSEASQKGPCYLCGKQNSLTHQNGIDRFDNTKGYTEENSRSCCSSCNYMKRDYEYRCFIEKLNMIFQHQRMNPIQEHINQEKKSLVPGNKRSKEELGLFRTKEKKDKQEKLIESYTKDREARIEKIVTKRHSRS
jgi:hypothetical protein